MKTYIRFVIFKGEVLGVFMRRDAARRFAIFARDGKGAWLRRCYAHIGQHGECYDGMEKRKQATPGEYAGLKEEMESLGYVLQVI